MGHNLINDLIQALSRVFEPDPAELTEIIVISGLPDKSQNIKYLAYNRHVKNMGAKKSEFNAVAVVNNRMASFWRLSGYKMKVSRIIFNNRWTRSPMDIFLNDLRCNESLMETLAWSAGPYTLFGILKESELMGKGRIKWEKSFVKPVVAVPGLDPGALESIIAFEKRNTICRKKMMGFPLQKHNV